MLITQFLHNTKAADSSHTLGRAWTWLFQFFCLSMESWMEHLTFHPKSWLFENSQWTKSGKSRYRLSNIRPHAPSQTTNEKQNLSIRLTRKDFVWTYRTLSHRITTALEWLVSAWSLISIWIFKHDVNAITCLHPVVILRHQDPVKVVLLVYLHLLKSYLVLLPLLYMVNK